jgi:hypothetical protein
VGPLTFAGGDAAHFTAYRYGETVSASIWWLERRYPVLHILVGLVLAVLFTHLEFQVP